MSEKLPSMFTFLKIYQGEEFAQIESSNWSRRLLFLVEVKSTLLGDLRSLAWQFGHFWNIGDRPGLPTLGSMPSSPSLPLLDRPATHFIYITYIMFREG